MRSLFAVLLIAALGSSAVAAPHRHPVASLQRFGCEGDCPVYKIDVWEDGTVEFRGEFGAKSKKVQYGKLSKQQLDDLKAAFAAAKFFDLPAKLACGDDAPSATTFFDDGKQQATKFHDTICDQHGKSQSQSRAFTQLEDTFDRIVNTKQWLR